jgi:ubiquinone/menaquinone biosynthesis C-methylase UbiE
MVHALNEIQRVLIPRGVLIDLRPLADHWAVEVASARQVIETGRVEDLPIGLEDDEAANNSVAQSEVNGWFTRESEETFPFYYSWDSPREMEQYISEEWENFIGLDDSVKEATRSAWASADADSRVRVRMKMLITRWVKSADTVK